MRRRRGGVNYNGALLDFCEKGYTVFLYSLLFSKQI